MTKAMVANGTTYEDYAKKYGEVYTSDGEVFAICSETYYLWTDARGYVFYQQTLADKNGVYVATLAKKPENESPMIYDKLIVNR